MIDARDMATRTAAVKLLLQEKHGVRAKDLARAVKRAGRRLPRRVRAQAQVLIEAERQAAIPKLAKRIDEKAVRAAEVAVTEHLSAIDVKARRTTRVLNLTGLIAAQVLFVVAGFIFWMWWREYL